MNGYLNTWSIAILMALTGNLMKKGAGFTGVFTTRYSPDTTSMWITKEYKQLNGVIPYGIIARDGIDGEAERQAVPYQGDDLVLR